MRNVPTLLRYGAWIGTQHAEQRRALLERRQRLGDVRLVGMTVDVEEGHVVPCLSVRGPRLDGRQADLVFRQRLEKPEQRARRVGVQRRAEDGGAVVSGGLEDLPSHDK